jgi:hypothetical protein
MMLKGAEMKVIRSMVRKVMTFILEWSDSKDKSEER